MSYTPHNLVDKIFKDKDGHVKVWQFPNFPLWAWIICTALGLIIKHGRPHTGLHLLGQASLFAWAYLELRHGDSLFRRILGAVILLGIIVSFFSAKP